MHAGVYVGNRREETVQKRAWWEDHITMGFKEIGWKSVDWIHLAQFRGWGHSCEHCKVLLAS